MHKTNRSANLYVKQILIDMAMIVLSFYVAYYITNAHEYAAISHRYGFLLASFCLIFFLFMNSFRMYDISTFFYIDKVIKLTAFSMVGTSMLIFMYLYMTFNFDFSRLFFGVFEIICMGFLLTGRAVSHKLGVSREQKNMIIYIGDKDIYKKFVHFSTRTEFNHHIIGYITTNGQEINDVECLGQIEDFEEIIKQHTPDEVIFSFSVKENISIEKYIEIAAEMGVIVRVILDLYAFTGSKMFTCSMGTYPMVTYYCMSLNKAALLVKRVIDIIGAVIGICLALPIMLVTAILIKIDSPGPIMFKQYRAGRGGKKFKIYKFRSMYVDAEERKKELMSRNEMTGDKIFKIKDDPRVTRIGKFIRKMSIDELPQFFNVLIGDMSLVGTRPPTLDEISHYDRQHWRRISIKPGITGIWQTSGRNEISDFNEIVRMDMEYIENWSILLDIRLMFKTLSVLVNKSGAY